MAQALIDKYYDDDYKAPNTSPQESWTRRILQTSYVVALYYVFC